MQHFLRQFLRVFTVLFLFMGLFPPLAPLFLGKTADAPSPPAASASPDDSLPSPAESTVPAGSFRVWDTGANILYTLSEADFLRGAVLCEMSPAAPKEALKAQAVAAATLFSRRKQESAGRSYDFTSDSARRLVYMTDSDAARYFGADWPEIQAAVDALCVEVLGQRVLWEGAPAETRYCAISAGCTRAFEEVSGGAALPYLCGVACPFDQLWDGYLSEPSFTPEEIRAAFPAVSFSDDPAAWFSEFDVSKSRYVRTVSLCGETFSGDEIREALGLRSAAFSVEFDGERFAFTVRGWGCGVGMSQAGAIYLAELGADYRDILAFFYPGTSVEPGP